MLTGSLQRDQERWNENACVKERRVVRVCNISSYGLALHERKWEEKNRASRAKKKWKQNRTTQSKAVIEDEKNEEEEEAAAVIYHLAFFFPFIVLFNCLLLSHAALFVLSLLLLSVDSSLFLELFDFWKESMVIYRCYFAVRRHFHHASSHCQCLFCFLMLSHNVRVYVQKHWSYLPNLICRVTTREREREGESEAKSILKTHFMCTFIVRLLSIGHRTNSVSNESNIRLFCNFEFFLLLLLTALISHFVRYFFCVQRNFGISSHTRLS